MKRANVTVVIMTHRMGALAATDRIAIMEGGSVVAFGESEEIFERHLSRPQVASQIETSESSVAAGGAPARSGFP
jgi:ATP-binding cassette subfamily C protein